MVGLSFLATAQNRLGAQTAGIHLQRVDMIGFGIGVGLAAAAGALPAAGAASAAAGASRGPGGAGLHATRTRSARSPLIARKLSITPPSDARSAAPGLGGIADRAACRGARGGTGAPRCRP
jgi:hypothetical protein